MIVSSSNEVQIRPQHLNLHQMRVEILGVKTEQKYLTSETLAVAVVTRCGENANIVSSTSLSLWFFETRMENNCASGTKPSLRATSDSSNALSLADVFITGTARACAVKNCFKRNTHYHCSLCPDRRIVKYLESMVYTNERLIFVGHFLHSVFDRFFVFKSLKKWRFHVGQGQNMVVHQVYHVNGRLEKRSIRDNNFLAFNGQCGRAMCRFDKANKKHHHCKICDWPCCGRKLQRCSGHIKTKHPEVFNEAPNDSMPSKSTVGNSMVNTMYGDMMQANAQPDNSSFKDSRKQRKPVKIEQDESNMDGKQAAKNAEIEEDVEESYDSDHDLDNETIHVERSDETENAPWKSNALNPSFYFPPNGNKTRISRTSTPARKVKVEDVSTMEDGNDLNGLKNEERSADQTSLTPSVLTRCDYVGCRVPRSHFHCNLCEFITNKKNLLERHQNIHARGFHEKRKQREMYFTGHGATAQCGVPECRFTALKQKHFHCKFCGWAGSSRKLQRCIKHIGDKHNIDVSSSFNTDASRPLNSSSSSHLNDTSESQSTDTRTVAGSAACDTKTVAGTENAEDDDVTSGSQSELKIPVNDDFFFSSYADVKCDVDKCYLRGLHFHCKRCPFVTRQKRSRLQHRAIHLKRYPERRMVRDLHFHVYDGDCGRACRFSIAKKKHFHCKYCEWPCCARKMPRCFNHLKRKHADLLNEEEEECISQPSEAMKRTQRSPPEDVTSSKKQKKSQVIKSPESDSEHRVIILEEDNMDCPFVIKDVHSLRDSTANDTLTSEESPSATINGNRDLYSTSNSHPIEAGLRERRLSSSSSSYDSPFKQYKRSSSSASAPVYNKNGHGYQVHQPDRQIFCRVCRALGNERLPMRKMVVYSSSNHAQLDLRLTSLLCTYYRVSIEDAFNGHICERDFQDWCNFHAQKISVYPVIAVENGCDGTQPPRVVAVEEPYTQF
eukprot:gene20328-22327_t